VRRPKPSQGCRANNGDDANGVMISADGDFYYKKSNYSEAEQAIVRPCATP
jgi:hypothetical protein